MVAYAGGTSKYIPLKPEGKSKTANDWTLDMDHLQSLVTDKTKMIFFNNPNNPLGKVFSVEECQGAIQNFQNFCYFFYLALADFCIKNDIVCISDEVYEHLVYKPLEHIRIANLPGMYERTITIGSAGKTWSATGWKIGWSMGPPTLIKAMQVCRS